MESIEAIQAAITHSDANRYSNGEDTSWGEYVREVKKAIWATSST